VRLAIPGKQAIRVKGPPGAAVLVSLRGAVLHLVPATGEPAEWKTDPGSAIAIAKAVDLSVENTADEPVDLLAVVQMDPAVYGRVSVPPSMMDPVLVDPDHFRAVLEKGPMRGILLHLGPGEVSRKAQFAAGVRVAVTDGNMNETAATGEKREVAGRAGAAVWEKDALASIENLADKPIDSLLLEWKRPFCYSLAVPSPDRSEEAMAYVRIAVLNMRHNWYSRIPYEAKMGAPGLVQVNLKIQNDGIVRESDIVLARVFASEPLVKAALSAVRTTAPFDPLAGTFAYPELELRVVFIYNLPNDPSGCE